MKRIKDAAWIKSKRSLKNGAVDFHRCFNAAERVVKAELEITAHGVFEAFINSKRVSADVLMPGWTAYEKRLQVITYEVTDLIKPDENNIKIGVGKGWFFHDVKEWGAKGLKPDEPALLCALTLTYADGSEDIIYSDSSWLTSKSNIVYNNIYNGEKLDLTYKDEKLQPASEIEYSKDILIPLEGELIREQEHFTGEKLIVTPKGETVIDFGQEITGYVEFSALAEKGEKIIIKHFEVLDKDGNVYTENLRGAKATYTVISDGKVFKAKPSYTFYGFRYIQVIGLEIVNPEAFTAIAVHSEIRRTAHFTCSDELLNRFAQNVKWGQKGNFLDVPTDCPQRDERLGWTGDAAMFSRTAAINFDVKKFFDKWLSDVEANQLEDGSVPHVVPYVPKYWNGRDGYNSPAWSDVAIIAPWEMYMAYGDKGILERHYNLMKNWLGYMISECKKKGKGELKHPWTDGGYGDWLSLEELEREESSGTTDKGLIATAFLANDLKIMIKVNALLGYDTEEYEAYLENTLEFFRSEYMENGKMKQETQTAAVLAIVFGLTDNTDATCAQLTENVRRHGRITTGFIGSTWLLDALTIAGEDKLAVDLLLRTEYPSWLYPVTKGATTVWERWNGIFPDGRFANAGMNSFNHYAYGSVFSWMFRRLAGIAPVENAPGYKAVIFSPCPDERIPYVKASFTAAQGRIISCYEKTLLGWKFTFTVPENCMAAANLFGKTYMLQAGENKISVNLM